MAGKKSGGGGGDSSSSKKVAGNARKAEAAAQKAAAEEAKKATAEATEWQQGAKDSSRKEADAAKKAEQARKKAERDALLASEEQTTAGRATPKNSKAAVKKTNRGLDLAQLDSDGGSGGPLATLNASGIDNALDALSLTAAASSAADAKIDRHPERRFKAAFAAFEERRLREMDGDGSGQGLRLNQKKERIKKEFERSPENPFNQATASYDASKDDVGQIRERERSKVETRLGQK